MAVGYCFGSLYDKSYVAEAMENTSLRGIWSHYSLSLFFYDQKIQGGDAPGGSVKNVACVLSFFEC